MKKTIRKCIWVTAVSLAGLLSGCASEQSGSTEEVMQKTMSLQEYLETADEEWFLAGKKKYAVQAMMVSKETSFQNDLEEADYTVTDDGITVIIRGTAGELWTNSITKVMTTYTKPDGSEISASDFETKDTFIDLVSIPSPDSNYAMHVPMDISVTVTTARGNVLHTNLPTAPHGEGDYLVCRAGSDQTPDLSDVWVLNGAVFPNTYDTAHDPNRN